MSNPIGRPTVITPETIAKLEEVFAIGGSDEEACFYANIGKTTLYNYQQEHPEFVERKEALKEKPILLARQTVVKSLGEPHNAFRYLEKKRRKEFGNAVDITSQGDKLGSADSTLISELTIKLNEVYRGPSITSDGGATLPVGTEEPHKE